MQVDGEEDPNLLHLFDTSPDTFPWRGQVPHQVTARRRLLAGLLFFDILLSSGGIRDPDALYPPTDTPSLLILLQAIENSSYDTLKKDCLVYFLLKWHGDQREVKFAEDRCIPPQFSALSEAYWYLDTGFNVERAISILSDARLNRDYASKILEVISLTENPTPLILKYVRTSKPSLTESKDVDKYTLALAETNFLEAWQFQRTFSEESEIRPRLLRKILRWCLTPNPRSKPLKQLLAYPLSAYEQSLLHSYALNPPHDIPAASIPIMHDLVCIRLIHSGQFAAAIKLDRQFTITGSRITETSKKMGQDRRRMVDETMAVMPAIERQLIETELSQLAQGKDSMNASTSNSRVADSWINVGSVAINDLSMSWEHVRPNPVIAPPRPVSFGNGSAVFLSERVGGPRSGDSVFTSNAAFLPHTSHSQFPPNATSQPPVPPLTVSVSTPAEPSGRLRQNVSKFSQVHDTEAASLFDSIGSANHVRNAFYDPSPVAGVKRRHENENDQERLHRTMEAPPSHSDHDDVDIQMHSDDQRSDSVPPTIPPGDEPPSQFSFSVFGTSSVNGGKPSPVSNAKPKMPPGAFMSESEDEHDIQTTNGRFSISASPPPPSAARTSRPRGSAQQNTKEKNIPGALFYGESEEEEDVVVPLSKRPQRTRTTAKSHKPTRRSSRLSSASRESPPSPDRASRTKSTRKPTRSAAATASRTSGRVKR